MPGLLEQYGKRPPKILLYGKPGSGKTALASTLGKYAEYLDLDDGLETAVSLKDVHTSMRHSLGVVFRYVDESPTKAVAYNAFKDRILQISDMCSKKQYGPKAIVIDSLTMMAHLCGRSIVGATGLVNRNPQLQEWGLIINEIKNICIILKSLPVCVMMIAHQQTTTVDEMEYVEIGVPGKKLPSELTSFFDELWYMKARARSPVDGGGFGYTIQTKQTAGIMARTRKQVVDGTDANLGMVEILRRCGYEIEPTLPATPAATKPV